MKNPFKDKKPFEIVWGVFSLLSSILGLSSIADSIVSWKGFIKNILDAYQSIVHPFFSFLFSWIPFKFPDLVYDYLFISVIVSVSSYRSIYDAKKKIPPIETDKYGNPLDSEMNKYFHSGNPKTKWGKIKRGFIMSRGIFIIALIWPIYVVFMYYYKPKRRPVTEPRKLRMEMDKELRASFYQWLAAILFGFILLLIINSALNIL